MNQCFARSSPREQQSTGLLHLDLFDSLPSSGNNKSTPGGVLLLFGAGYGNRTRLHGLGSRCITDIRTLHRGVLYHSQMENSTVLCRNFFFWILRLCFPERQSFFLVLWETTNLAKNPVFLKMWLNFQSCCDRIYECHYGRIAPFWQSPKQRRTEKCLIP